MKLRLWDEGEAGGGDCRDVGAGPVWPCPSAPLWPLVRSRMAEVGGVGAARGQPPIQPVK